MDISPHRKSVTFRLNEDIHHACQIVGFPVGFRITGDRPTFIAGENDDLDQILGSMGCHEDDKINVRHVRKP